MEQPLLLPKRVDSSSSNNIKGKRLAILGVLVMFAICAAAVAAGLWITLTSDPCPCTKIKSYTGNTTLTGGPGLQLPEPGLVMAFLGDQALRHGSRQVLRLIQQEKASVVFHLGDFDYQAAPRCWTNQLFDILGTNTTTGDLSLDYFAVMGNHDARTKHLTAVYSNRIMKLLHPVAATCCCEGKVGVKATCTWKGLAFLQIGLGSSTCYSGGMVDWVRSELARLAPVYPWRFCLFHKNIRSMQMGTVATDEVPLALYEACRIGGAIVATAHDHRYARTHLMDSFGPVPNIVSTSTTLAVSPNHTFAFVSGLGGHSIRPAVPSLLANPWWASSLNAGDPLADFGALFLRIGGDPRTATAYFKTATNGDLIDSFNITV